MEAYSWLKIDATVVGTTVEGRTAIGPAFTCRPNGGLKKRLVVCECECGRIAVVESGAFTRGTRCTSCARIGTRNPNYRNGRGYIGKSPTVEYATWSRMNARCHNPRSPKYKSYGGRGIVVCGEWRGPGGFNRFLEHVGARPSDEHSIDRIDNDGNYEPGNVRWATRKQQARNTRRNRFLTIDGVTMTMAEWAERTGVSIQTIADRVHRGLTGVRLLCG